MMVAGLPSFTMGLPRCSKADFKLPSTISSPDCACATIYIFTARYGQWKAFWDSTGGLWATGALAGKYAGVFVTVGTQGGGQEETIQNSLSTLVHHGIIYVPLGYKSVFPLLTNMEEIHGGSPWGAGAFAGADDSRKPSALEHEIARMQGKLFAEHLSRLTL